MVLGRSIYGVDIGSSSVKIACVAKSGGRLTLSQILHVPLPSEHAAGTDSWLIAASQAISIALKEKGMRLGSVVLGVGGRETILRYSQIPPVPDARLELIMKYQIDEISSKSEETVTADYRVLPVRQDFSDDLTVLIALAKENYVSRHLKILAGVSHNIRTVNVAPVAVYNAYAASAGRMLAEGDENLTTLVVSIGAENTDIAIARGRGLMFARSVSKGAREFTEALAESMDLSFDEAEHVKITGGKIKTDSYRSDSERAVCDALLPVAGEFAALLNSSVQFAKSQIKLERLKIDRVLLTGGGGKLSGFADFLADRLGVQVAVLDCASTLSPSKAVTSNEDYHLPAAEYTTAIGLAASVLETDAIGLDLLPEKQRSKREFAERTRFLIASGVAAFVFILIFLVFAWMEMAKAREAEDISTQIVNEIGERRNVVDADEGRNKKTKSIVNYSSLFTRRGFYLSILMTQLGNFEVTPPEVVIDEVRLDSADAGKGKGSGPVDFSIRVVGRVTGDKSGRSDMDIVLDFRDRLRASIDESMKKMDSPELRPRINIDAKNTRRIREHYQFEITMDLKSEVSSGE
jgi:type IV pilus assembly protein PilM